MAINCYSSLSPRVKVKPLMSYFCDLSSTCVVAISGNSRSSSPANSSKSMRRVENSKGQKKKKKRFIRLAFLVWRNKNYRAFLSRFAHLHTCAVATCLNESGIYQIQLFFILQQSKKDLNFVRLFWVFCPYLELDSKYYCLVGLFAQTL